MKLLMRPGLDIAGGESRDDKYPLILVFLGMMALSALLWWLFISAAVWASTAAWAIIQIWS